MIEQLENRRLFSAILYGDVNFDKVVDITDFTIMAKNFNKTAQTYKTGDLNWDSKIDNSDYVILAANFNKTQQAKPDATNTGPINLSILKPIYSTTITKDNTILENFTLTGNIDVNAKNVIIRNFKIIATGSFCIRVGDTGSALIQDGSLDGGGTTAANITGPNFTAQKLNVFNAGSDGFTAKDNTVIDSCYIHDLGVLSTAHADGVQVSHATNVTITNNNFNVLKSTGHKSNSSVFIKADFGPISNVLVQGNWLDGGNYTVYSYDVGSNLVTNTIIKDNVFGRSAQYGQLSIKSPATTVGNNVFEDNFNLV
jgi:hypothetical protein